MLDKKGKFFGKVSVIDLIIVIVLILTILGSFLVIKKINNKEIFVSPKGLINQQQIGYLEVKMRLSEVRSMTCDAIAIGDEVFMAETDKYLGEVTNINVEPAIRTIYDLTGTAVEASVPERYDVILTLRVPGSKLENGYFTSDNIQLVYDSTMEIKTVAIQSTPTIETINTLPSE